MNKKLQLLLVLCLAQQFSAAQDKTAEFKNGKKIDYTIVSKTPADMHRFTIFGGLSLNEADPRLDLAATYLIPEKVQFGINIVPISSYGANIFFFLAPKEKEKTVKVYLASRQYRKDTTTLYVSKEIVNPKSFLALHLAYEHYDYNYPINQLGAGLAWNKFTHYRIVIHEGDDRTKVKTKQFMLGADVLYYPGKKVGDLLLEWKNEKVVSPVGGKVFYEFRSGFNGTKDFGGYVRLSVEYDLAGNITPKGALGLFGGF
ncbi:MAG TPA: hypothetical protein VFF27_12905 [Bacteroidia bacterium]|jgi:hypothetical protein|nr:hypothetical protein [Bacteroidia bacterium]